MGKQRCSEKYLLKFPAYYRTLPCNCPKEGALYDYDEFEAYRACIEENVSLSDFISYFEKGENVDEKNAASYSISLFTEFEKARHLLKSKRYKTVAKGIIKKHNGPVRKAQKSYHVDWWLYQGANPVNDFEVIT